MSRRMDQATRIRSTAAEIDLEALRAALRRCTDSVASHPGAASTDGTRGRGGTSSTEALAMTPDPAARELADLDRTMRRIEADLAWLVAFTARHTPRPPSDRDRREVERANTTPDPLCEHCTPHRRPGFAEPVHRTGTVAGNLRHTMGLCRWCYDRVRNTGRLPTGEELERVTRLKKDAVRG